MVARLSNKWLGVEQLGCADCCYVHGLGVLSVMVIMQS